MNDAPAAAPPENPSRRKLFAALALGAAGAAVAGVAAAVGRFVAAPLGGRAGSAQSFVELGTADAFADVRDGKTGAKEIVVTRTVDDGYTRRKLSERIALVADRASPSGLAALSTTCTHLGCGVSWSQEKKAFLCPCHGGVYDATGKVVAGPPPRPLARLPLVVEAGRVRLDVGAMA